MSLSFAEGVRAQPGNLRAAARTAGEVLSGADLTPFREGTLVLSGIGASWHALAPAIAALRAGGRRAFAVPSTELAHAGPAHLGDAYVIVSQSGRSTEPIAALEALDGQPLAVVSADNKSPLGRAAGLWLPLGDVPDTPLSTLAYTATLQTLGLLCDALLGVAHAPEWKELPDLVDTVLGREDAHAADVASRLQPARTIDAIGGGGASGTAGETALLAREGLRMPAYGEETRQYLHGPLEAVDETFGCLLFGDERELSLSRALVGYGATVAVVTATPGAESPGADLFLIPEVSDLATPILEILPVQLLVDHLARAKGLPADGLRRSQDDTKAT
ncbi:MAG: SIS domain-containing protein [Solirubrobacteraceae bacterium]